MRKILLLAVLVTATSFAQDYPFLRSFKRTNMSVLADYLNTLPVSGRDSLINLLPYYKENGTLVRKAYADSLSKTKDFYRYTTRVYKDSLVNTFAYVIHWRSDDEMEADGKQWKKNSEDDEKNRKKLLGSTLDELVLADMDGNTHTLESLSGKIIVIDFWFVNCAACIKEMPELNKLREDLGTEAIAWFGVTFDKKEKVEKFLEKVNFDFTVIPDSKHIVDRFNINFFPTTLIISPGHKIVYTGKLGPMSGRTAEIKKMLKKVLKENKKKVKKGVVAGPIERQ